MMKVKMVAIQKQTLFSRKIQEMGFGLYKAEIEAVDDSGNKMLKQWPEILVVH